LSDYDAYPDDMERISRLSDGEIDGILAGQAPSEDTDLEELAAFMLDVGWLFRESSTEETAARHLAAIAEAVRLLPEDAGGVTPRRGSSSVRERSGHARFRLRSKPMRAKLLVATASLLLLLAFGGAAFAGALPGPVQGTVADVVGNVGVTLPGDGSDVDSDDESVIEGDDSSDVDTDDQGDDDKGQPADDDQGDQGDDEQGDDDQGDQGDDEQGDDDQGDQGDDQGDDDQGDQGDDDQGDDDQGDQGDDDQGDDDQGDQGDDDQGNDDQSDDDQGDED
jgi:hypothetical protein